MSCHQNAGQNCDINVTDVSFENVAEFIYLERIREGHRLRMFDNRELRKTFEPKMDESNRWMKAEQRRTS